MPALRDIQRSMAEAILHGPAHVPHIAFHGDERRVSLGFAVHANTISHGRLVALEDTFPKTRAFIGEDRFNERSREFLESGQGSDASLNELGCNFPDWLDDQGEALAATFARFDWAWLESYRAAEQTAMSRDDLAALDESGLISLKLAKHPACFLMLATPDLSAAIELNETSENILVTRPAETVLVNSADAVVAQCLRHIVDAKNVGGMLAEMSGEFADDAILPTILHLIDAGALVRASV